jgi:hypothetical protein
LIVYLGYAQNLCCKIYVCLEGKRCLTGLLDFTWVLLGLPLLASSWLLAVIEFGPAGNIFVATFASQLLAKKHHEIK